MMPLPAGDADTDAASLAASELAALCQAFPHFRIWCEAIGPRVRYVAVRQRPGIILHTFVTTDLAELRFVLAEATARTRHPVTSGGWAGQSGQSSVTAGPASASRAPLTGA